ncbi:hypothetical protein GCM10025787_09630 [Saccharopolyspora rosea]
MRRIRGFIEDHLAAPDLGPARIAAAHYISTRHLHNIFREHGTTVASRVRARRLESCRRDLLDPVHADSGVAAIAAKPPGHRRPRTAARSPRRCPYRLR